MQLYNQLDSRWSTKVLGYNPVPSQWTIGSSGCLIASQAIILSHFNISLNVLQVNNLYKQESGFQAGNGLYIWGTIPRLFDIKETQHHGFDQDIIKKTLANGGAVMLEVDFRPASLGKDQHFVVAKGYNGEDLRILDPNGGVERSINYYGWKVYRVITYTQIREEVPQFDEEYRTEIVGANEPGTSYVLERIGFPSYDQLYAWETVAWANGYHPKDWNIFNSKLQIGQEIIIPERFYPIEETPVVSDVKVIKQDNTPLVSANTDEVQVTGPHALPTEKGSIIDSNNNVSKKTLPIWKRSIYDTLRDGSYGIGGILTASGAFELAMQFIETGDFSEQALTNLLLGVGMAILGYLQAIQKQNRKKKENN